MKRITINTGKKVNTKDVNVIDFTNVFEYWNGGMMIIPQAIQNIHLSDYKNNRCLSWYEKQQMHHDQLMTEFKKIFKWQKR